MIFTYYSENGVVGVGASNPDLEVVGESPSEF